MKLKAPLQSKIWCCTRSHVEEEGSCLYGTRHTQIILLFSLVSIAYTMRIMLSVAIVAMTTPKSSANSKIPIYEWNNKNVILSSFFWGYSLTQILAGVLARKYGPKYFIAITMTLGSLVSILMPTAAHFGSWFVIGCRIVQGASQGFIYPSCHHLLSQWAPPKERARFGTFVYAGGSFGTVICMFVTGWLSSTDFGWPSAFYLYGIIGLLWTVAWLALGQNSPKDHKTINAKERAYIEQSLKRTHERKPMKTPWKSIFSSIPLWAILVAQFGQGWGFTTLITTIPTYMADVLNFNIRDNGLLLAGPYFTHCMHGLVFSSVIDFSISRKFVSTAVARKIANTIGSVVPAISLIILGIISSTSTDTVTEVLILLFIAVGINSSCCCGYQLNHIDIAPDHSGTLMGLTNTFANFASMLGPLLVHFVVTDYKNPHQWAPIFYIAAMVYITGDLLFVIFASGEIQAWNYPPEDEKTRSEKHIESTEKF